MAIISDRLRASKAYGIFQSIMRVLQFLSALISMALFSARIYKIIRLARRASTSNGAVEGILVAAVVYTLVALILRLCLKGGASKWVRYILILFDIAFVAAFIVVAYLTRPHGGSSGPCRRAKYQQVKNLIPKDANCNLPWGTFILAIFSTIFHALTAIFHEARDHYKQTHHQKGSDRDMEQDNYARNGQGKEQDNHMRNGQGMEQDNHMRNGQGMDQDTRTRAYEEARNGQ